jgi:hypothetical protein
MFIASIVHSIACSIICFSWQQSAQFVSSLHLDYITIVKMIVFALGWNMPIFWHWPFTPPKLPVNAVVHDKYWKCHLLCFTYTKFVSRFSFCIWPTKVFPCFVSPSSFIVGARGINMQSLETWGSRGWDRVGKNNLYLFFYNDKGLRFLEVTIFQVIVIRDFFLK